MLRTHARRILEDETAAYHHEAAGWPALTDHDRLEQAFAALETQGVVCRQNFTCCGTCGVAEIGDDREIEEIDGARRVRLRFESPLAVAAKALRTWLTVSRKEP